MRNDIGMNIGMGAGMAPPKSLWRRLDLSKAIAIYDPNAKALGGAPYLIDDGAGIEVNGGLTGGAGAPVAIDTGVWAIWRLTDVIGEDFDPDCYGSISLLTEVVTEALNQDMTTTIALINEADLTTATVDGGGGGVYYNSTGSRLILGFNMLNGVYWGTGGAGGATTRKSLTTIGVAGNAFAHAPTIGLNSTDDAIANFACNTTVGSGILLGSIPYIALSFWRGGTTAGAGTMKVNARVSYTLIDRT